MPNEPAADISNDSNQKLGNADNDVGDDDNHIPNETAADISNDSNQKQVNADKDVDKEVNEHVTNIKQKAKKSNEQVSNIKQKAKKSNEQVTNIKQHQTAKKSNEQVANIKQKDVNICNDEDTQSAKSFTFYEGIEENVSLMKFWIDFGNKSFNKPYLIENDDVKRFWKRRLEKS